MRFAKFLSLAALLVPLTFTGCGDDSGTKEVASDQELIDYGKEKAKGTPLEGMTLGKPKE